MTPHPRRPRWRLPLLGICACTALVLGVWLLRGKKNSPTQDAFPYPPYSASRYLNTGPDAHYVGINTCAECHKNNHRSFLHTAHSRALSDLDPKAEPPDGAFTHAASGRSYRVYRQGGEFRHEEVLRTSWGKEIARMDLPIRYLVGSGNFSRTYLVELDGFLHESPITWYTGKKKWDVSPGYDFPDHWGFERPIGMSCLFCHAGRVEPDGQSVHRLKFREQAIGCESCHGPGSVHVELHKHKKHPPGEEDLTIVNPSRLSRPLLESVCAFCHLSGVTPVLVRGRSLNDFRPGTPLGDYRTNYKFDKDEDQMTVVGHIEQLRLSACYQKSSSMSCLTCHDPHAKEKPKDQTAYYRQKCLDCHASQPCRMDPLERRKKDSADNCVACHMPVGDTDIPHIAFTHHRIGLHKPQPKLTQKGIPRLVPTDDDGHLPPHDQQRNLAWAYVLVADNPQYDKYAETYRERARELLEPLHAAGLRDGVTAEALAKIHWKTDPTRAAAFAAQALAENDLPPEGRAVALVIQADCYSQAGETEAAIKVLLDLVKMRRQAEDWRLLGKLYLDQKQPQQALDAFLQALAIRPYRYDIHGGLAEAYRQLGDARRSRDHEDKAQWLYNRRRE